MEEELFVLAADTLEPAPFPAESFDGARLKAELFVSVVELTTGVCRSVGEAVAELDQLRKEAKKRAAAAGLVLAAAGTWPTAMPEEQVVTAEDGYRRFVEYAGPSARRQYCSGLHVHVGMASPAACMGALEAALPWLPVVLAVSANSPYLAGRETGLSSSRAEILALLPRSGAPPAFDGYGAWEEFAKRLVRLGLADNYRRIWWDVRPHPGYGTLELRMPDQPTSLEATAAVAGLLHALAGGGAAAPGDRGIARADRGIYEQNRWAALRFGRRAMLIHPDGSRLATVDELLAELLERLGHPELLEPLTRLDQAQEQLELGREKGLRAVCERLTHLT